jgi:hypothetical protein
MGQKRPIQENETRFLSQKFDVDKRTVRVNFAKQEQLMDANWANACVRVHTVTVLAGTTSHLDIGIDPVQFATDLKTNVGAGLPGDSGGWR